MGDQQSGIFDQSNKRLASNRAAARSNARSADSPEKQAMEELLALGQELTREKAETTQRIQSLQSKLQAAEDRAATAEAQMKELQAAEDRAEDRAATAEAQARELRAAEDRAATAEAQMKRVAEEVEAERRHRSETDERLVRETVAMREKLEALRAEADERIGLLQGETGSVTERAAESNGSADQAHESPAARQAEDSREVAKPRGNRTGGMLSLNEAAIDELRYLGMSMTQAKRVLKFREDRPFASTEDLNQIPGFSQDFLKAIEGRVTP